jgi:hypothetical protein
MRLRLGLLLLLFLLFALAGDVESDGRHAHDPAMVIGSIRGYYQFFPTPRAPLGLIPVSLHFRNAER